MQTRAKGVFSMNVILGTEIDKNEILEKYPHTTQAIGNGGFLIVAKNGCEIIGFLWAFMRDIPVAVSKKEMFINVIEVFGDQNRCNGIGSSLVEKCIEIARIENCYQIRAYCDANNIPSTRMWIKNGFAISPVKMDNGSIPGSYITYKL